MSGSRIGPRLPLLRLPRFVLHPLTAMIIAAVHVYLAYGHISDLLAGHVTWTNLWKGSGALGGAYVFAALASRTIAIRRRPEHDLASSPDASR
jgi:hypothetical protein